MKTLLIPVDASTTNPALVNFAAEWIKKYQYERVVMLQSLYENVFDAMAMSADYAAVNQDVIAKRREDVMWKLNDLAQAMQKLIGEKVEVTMAWSELPLLRAVVDAVRAERPQLIMLENQNGEDPISEQVIPIAKASPVRVLVVPSGMAWQPVEKALIPVDFTALKTIDKMHHLKQSPLWVPTEVTVLNIDARQHYLTPDETFNTAIAKLKTYLEGYNYKIEFRDDEDIIGGIIRYADENKVQLIIALPGRHSFLYTLTHKSISEGIYKAANLPVMILK
ncbi:hypothetical protein [Chitinophaga sp. Cy-1792]|uniref:hypothetical protein n=1 Tax=Chitinophaga sp. Cy-1792 TaxID=2608339 RepID=UPI0014216F18|nr:hypothetical protein [Chitinophaga sp. Cy-1792]NIG54148.1 hypothetical protein [Chitinophaga sp. Cy-1792]